MSIDNTSQETVAATLPSPGFDIDQTGNQPAPDDSKAERQNAQVNKKAEMQRNFRAVFGHGIGKLSLIIAAIIILGGAALGYRGLTKPQTSELTKAEFDTPAAPTTKAGVDEVSASEAERRKEIAAKEALEAEAAGKAYQPAFDPAIRPDDEKLEAKGGEAQFAVDMASREAQIAVASAEANAAKASSTPASPKISAQSPILLPSVGAKQETPESTAINNRTNSTPSQSMPTSTQPNGNSFQSNSSNPQPVNNQINQIAPAPPRNQRSSQPMTQAEQQAAQKLAEEYRKLAEKRDKFVDSIEKDTMAAVTRMFGSEAQSALGTYTTSVYSTTPIKAQETTTTTTAPTTSNRPEALGDPRKRQLIKTGNTMYFTLDSEVNTDDGGIVMGTIRGGEWNGSRVLGAIEQAPNNIRIKISTIAPQDSRPTMRVNAVALREVDAKQGIAEEIDHHTFSRYASLAAASALTGYGKAYQQPAGTTIMSGTGTVTSTTTDPSNKRVIGNIVGELGIATGQEVRRGFNRPSTYSTPAEKGMALYFLQDVFEQ